MSFKESYRVIRKLESGGMAEVFLAESEGIYGFRKVVAIKRILPQLSDAKAFTGMFLDEARLSAQLSHSNCVQVFDIGVGDDAYFIVMEYVEGINLRHMMTAIQDQGRKIPVHVAIWIAIEICKGLAYAHTLTDRDGALLQIVHRDISPPNILISKYGEVKIVDFGLAKAHSQLEKTEPGIIKGKFGYFSPEAAMGVTVDARTDIFAVGIVLWELLAGKALFAGNTVLEAIRKIRSAEAAPVSTFNPNVTPALERVVHQALALSVTDRYQTAYQLAKDLNTILFQYGHPVQSYDVAHIALGILEKRELEPSIPNFVRENADQSESLLEFTSINANGMDSTKINDHSEHGTEFETSVDDLVGRVSYPRLSQSPVMAEGSYKPSQGEGNKRWDLQSNASMALEETPASFLSEEKEGPSQPFSFSERMLQNQLEEESGEPVYELGEHSPHTMMPAENGSKNVVLKTVMFLVAVLVLVGLWLFQISNGTYAF